MEVSPLVLPVSHGYGRYGEPTRSVDLHKFAFDVVKYWSEHSPDGSSDDLIRVLELNVGGLLRALCDA